MPASYRPVSGSYVSSRGGFGGPPDGRSSEAATSGPSDTATSAGRLEQHASRISRRHQLGVRAGVPFGPDARRAAGLARAGRDQLARALEQQPVHLEQRPAEADAARIVVVDEDVRSAAQRLRRRRPCRRSASIARATRRRSTRRCRADRTSAAAARRAASRTPARRRRRADRRRRTAAPPSPPAGIVSQYDEVCICCSGRSSSPDPTFSFV